MYFPSKRRWLHMYCILLPMIDTFLPGLELSHCVDEEPSLGPQPLSYTRSWSFQDYLYAVVNSPVHHRMPLYFSPWRNSLPVWSVEVPRLEKR